MSTRVGGSNSFDYSPETAVHESGESSVAAATESPTKSDSAPASPAVSVGESVTHGASKAYSQSVRGENDTRANQIQATLLNDVKKPDDWLNDPSLSFEQKLAKAGESAIKQTVNDLETLENVAGTAAKSFISQTEKDIDSVQRSLGLKLNPTPPEPMPDHDVQIPTRQKILDGIPPKSAVDDLRQPSPTELQDIRDSIKRGPKEQAIDKTIERYQIHVPSDYEVGYDPNGSNHTDINKKTIVLSRSDFESPERLAAAIHHGALIANETPEQQQRATAYPEARLATEIKAYDTQLSTGQLNKEQSDRIMQERTALFKKLSPADQKLVNQLNYERIPSGARNL